MGKNNKAQRTKNNARPSSSGRSAQLLHASNVPTQSLFGFTSVKDIGVEDLDSCVDPNYQQLLKKMNKKDSTTKTKALQEFSELVKQTDVEALKVVLPFWPRVFNLLSSDLTHRVRENCLAAHNSVVTVAGRHVAPHLRAMMPAWLAARYDQHVQAAQFANAAFVKAFPTLEKQKQAVAFCMKEVMDYVLENIKQEKAGGKDEESEARSLRSLVASLQVYRTYLEMMPQDALEQAKLENEAVVNKGFWKLARHPAPLVRSAWYSCVEALCVASPHLVMTSSASQAVLSGLDDADPTVLPRVWDAALRLVCANKNAWTEANPNKLVLPKLRASLKNACHGCASSILPCLLPLISTLPDEFISSTEFYDKTLEAFRQGFLHKTASQSRSESNALASHYVEICRYAIVKNQQNADFCLHIVENQIISAIDAVLSNPTLELISQPLFSCFTQLLHHWDRNQSTLLAECWTRLEPIVAPLEETESPDWSVKRRVELLVGVKFPKEVKTGNRVTFVRQASVCIGSTPSPASISSRLSTPLEATVSTLCLNLKNMPQHASHFSRLMQLFNTRDLVEKFAGGEEIAGWCEQVVIGDWLYNWANKNAVVDIAILSSEWLNESEMRATLDTLSQNCTGEVLCHFLSSCLQKASSGDTAIATSTGAWLRHSSQEVIERLAHVDSDREVDVLVQAAVARNARGERLLMKDGISHLVTLACSAPEHDLAISLVEAFTADQSTTRKMKADVSKIEQTEMEVRSEDIDRSACLRLILTLFEAALTGFDVLDTVGRGVEALEKWGMMREVGQKAAQIMASHVKNICHSDECTEIEKTVEPLSVLLGLSARDKINSEKVDEYLSFDAPSLDNLAANFIPLCDSAVLEMHLFSRSLHQSHASNEAFDQWEAIKKITVKTEEDIRKELDYYYSRCLLNVKLISRLFLSPTNENRIVDVTAKQNATILSEEDFEEEIEVFKKKAVDPKTEERLEKDIESEKVDEEGKELSKNDDSDDGNDSSSEDGEIAIETSSSSETRAKEPPSNENEEKCVLISEPSASSDDGGAMFQVLSEHFLRLFSCIALSQSLSTRYAGTVLNYATSKRRAAIDAIVKDILKTLKSADISSFFNKMLDIWEQYFSQTSPIVFASLPVETELASNDLTSLLITSVCDEDKVRMKRRLKQCWGKNRKVENYEVKRNEDMLYECDVATKPVEIVEDVAMRARDEVNRLSEYAATQENWDRVIVSTAYWTDSCLKSKKALLNIKDPEKCHRASLLLVNTCDLLISVVNMFSLKQNDETWQTRTEEWKNVFESDVTEWLGKIFIELCERTKDKTSVLSTPVYCKLGLALQRMDVAKYPDVGQLTSSCLVGLRSPSLIVQYSAFNILMSLAPVLVSQDAAYEDAATSDSTTTPDYVLQRIAACISHDVRSSLLCGHIILEMCHLAGDSLTSAYAKELRESNMLSRLLELSLNNMPARVADTTAKSSTVTQYFTTPVDTTPGAPWTRDVDERLACRLFWLCLSRLPAEVRSWWNSDCEHRATVERVTRRHVTPALCDLEMKQVQALAKQSGGKYDNMKVHVRASAREVTAHYSVDEARVELVIVLPDNHPLGPARIETPRNVVGTTQARTWLMQLTMFLASQNGSLWNGLSLWKSNLDKRFDGVEECYICFSVLSGSNFQLPKVCCRTCKKKFHSSCLFKWFSTSNKSTCPVCRNMF